MSATDELEHYMTACSGLRAETARLQTALTEAEIHLKTARWVLEMDDPRLLKALQTIERLIAERDGYKALAERRKEALDAWGRYSLSSKPAKELLVEALRLTDAAEEPR
ncbi:hypothetical protein LCGC14_1341630 [marine sediment metagenome]|uniref:Uncharacterized protein n=2 Tax=marine sediment metagenome TaxID=412755 RepID=A0A0F9KEB1_9ZZZZ